MLFTVVMLSRCARLAERKGSVYSSAPKDIDTEITTTKQKAKIHFIVYRPFIGRVSNYRYIIIYVTNFDNIFASDAQIFSWSVFTVSTVCFCTALRYNKKPTVRRQSVYRKEGENEENFAFGELFAGAFDQNYIDLKAASGTAR